MPYLRELDKPDHWAELLEADENRPYFFEYCMMIPPAADDIATSEYAMRGVFTYDQ